jgi:hypothetical protein
MRAWREGESWENFEELSGGIYQPKGWVEINAGEGDRQGGVMLCKSVPGHHNFSNTYKEFPPSRMVVWSPNGVQTRSDFEIVATVTIPFCVSVLNDVSEVK